MQVSGGARWALAASSVVVVVSVGLGVFLAVGHGGALRVPTSALIQQDSHAVFDRHAPATIRAVRHGDLVCFYGVDPDGDRLVFPAGYSASTDLHLLDRQGRDVAAPTFATGIAFGSTRVTAPAACGSSGKIRAVVRIEGLGG